MKLTDYFCKEFIESLKDSIDKDNFDLDYLKKHINECEKCNKSILSFVKENIKKINLFNLFKA